MSFVFQRFGEKVFSKGDTFEQAVMKLYRMNFGQRGKMSPYSVISIKQELLQHKSFNYVIEVSMKNIKDTVSQAVSVIAGHAPTDLERVTP